MEFTQDTYSKEEVQELFTEQEGKVTELTKSNLTNSIKLEMLKNGISEDMFDLVADSTDLEDATKKITKLVELFKKKKVDNSYKPENHATDDEYSVAEKKGDTQSMLKSKLSKLFQ